MKPNKYQRLAMRTKCSQTKPMRILADPEKIQVNHAVLGLVDEVGELASALEKHVYYGQEFDRVNLIEETGDCLWYLAELCDALGVTMEDVMERNIAKLKKRYPEKFTTEQAKEENRDREGERGRVARMVTDCTYCNYTCAKCGTHVNDEVAKSILRADKKSGVTVVHNCPECRTTLAHPADLVENY